MTDFHAVSLSETFRFEALVRGGLLKIVTVLLSVYAAAGCAARMTVSSHSERGLDASAYHTFDWGQPDALPVGDPRLDKNPFFKDQLVGAVEKGLARRGIALASTGAPDLLIHYHANISTRIDVNRADSAYGYCLQGACPLDTTAYEAGTLVLDVIDARTNRSSGVDGLRTASRRCSAIPTAWTPRSTRPSRGCCFAFLRSSRREP
jgi:hypothetical protein